MLWTVVIFSQIPGDTPVVSSSAALPEQAARAGGTAMLEARGVPSDAVERWRRAPAGEVLRAGMLTFGMVPTPHPGEASDAIGEWVAEHMW
ncbi:hypothetical protein ACLQ3K_22255 [Tsukamurella sp. DT100]|uniref:hypothetical protein n=1 Tax=Tsukamurella sp. DT100 TaxID=3393415 RepID=UPI003CFB22AE